MVHDELGRELDALEFDWVAARDRCSIGVAFERLKETSKKDTAQRNAQLARDKTPYSFRFDASGDWFAIVRQGEIHETVKVTLEGQAIVVYHQDRETHRATITFDVEGECRLVVKDARYRLWQFRRMVLEAFLFDR